MRWKESVSNYCRQLAGLQGSSDHQWWKGAESQGMAGNGVCTSLQGTGIKGLSFRAENEIVEAAGGLIICTSSCWQQEPQKSVMPLSNVISCLGKWRGTQQHQQQPGFCGALEKCPVRNRSCRSMMCPTCK